MVLPRACSASQEVTVDLRGLGSNEDTLEKWEQAAGGERSRLSEPPDVACPSLLPSLSGHHIHQALWREPANSTV